MLNHADARRLLERLGNDRERHRTGRVRHHSSTTLRHIHLQHGPSQNGPRPRTDHGDRSLHLLADDDVGGVDGGRSADIDVTRARAAGDEAGPAAAT